MKLIYLFYKVPDRSCSYHHDHVWNHKVLTGQINRCFPVSSSLLFWFCSFLCTAAHLWTHLAKLSACMLKLEFPLRRFFFVVTYRLYLDKRKVLSLDYQVNQISFLNEMFWADPIFFPWLPWLSINILSWEKTNPHTLSVWVCWKLIKTVFTFLKIVIIAPNHCTGSGYINRKLYTILL